MTEHHEVSWLLISIVTAADASLRVRVWRELRKLGAVYLHASVCLLPDRPEIRKPVHVLATRVQAGGGKARVLRVELTDTAEAAEVVTEQSRDREREYGEVVERTASFLAEIRMETERGRATYTEVEESEADLERFDRWYASITARDYFGALGRTEAETALAACRTALAGFEAKALDADTGADHPSGSQLGVHLRVVEDQ